MTQKDEVQALKKLKTEINELIGTCNTRINSLIKKNEKSLNSFTKIFESHGRFLTKVLKTMETIDETMGCILCAIRQNEYLQTYYPAQHGFPAMKTTGLHPAKTVKECKK